MTPPRSSIETRISSVESEISALKATQKANHDENRASIHDHRDKLQTLVDQGFNTAQVVTRLSRDMETVIGTDSGKKGKLDEIQADVKSILESKWIMDGVKALLTAALAAAAVRWLH